MSLVWDFDNSGNNIEELKELVESEIFQFEIDSNLSPHALIQYLGHNIKIIIYNRTVMVQGGGLMNPNEYIKNIVINLNNLKFLSLKENSKDLFQKFLPKKGLILCNKCNTANNYVELVIEEDKPQFIFDLCKCKLALKKYPFNIINRRLLPDLNIIISDALIRFF